MTLHCTIWNGIETMWTIIVQTKLLGGWFSCLDPRHLRSDHWPLILWGKVSNQRHLVHSYHLQKRSNPQWRMKYRVKIKEVRIMFKKAQNPPFLSKKEVEVTRKTQFLCKHCSFYSSIWRTSLTKGLKTFGNTGSYSQLILKHPVEFCPSFQE